MLRPGSRVLGPKRRGGFRSGFVLGLVGAVAGRAASFVPTKPATAKRTVAVEGVPPPPTGRGIRYFVSGNGDDRRSGRSIAQAFRSLQKASDLSQPGDVIWILNGTYENRDFTRFDPAKEILAQSDVLTITRSGTSGAYIKYAAYPGHSPLIRANKWNGIKIWGASYLVIEGLEIEGVQKSVSAAYAQKHAQDLKNPATSGNGISSASKDENLPHHLFILNNRVHDLPGGGIGLNQSDYVWIIGNMVSQCGFWSPYANSGISIYDSRETDDKPIYKNFVLRNNSYANRNFVPFIKTGQVTDGNGIIVDSNRHVQDGRPPYRGKTLIAGNLAFLNGGSGIHVFLSQNVDVVSNTAYLNNQTESLRMGQISVNQSAEVLVCNNILVAPPNKAENAVFKNFSGVRYDSNLYFGGTGPELRGPLDQVADPQFLDAPAGDFRLKPKSPAVDSASPRCRAEKDLDVLIRPRESGRDRGAF